MASKKKLLIIGGGFGGLNLAKTVDKKVWDVTIVDKNNYHSFPPLFYQVASSGLEPASICFPLRREMRSRHVRGTRFEMGEVSRIDVKAHTVTTNYRTLEYDALVIAAGTTNNFFGIPDLEKNVYTLKSASEAIRCRNEVLDRLERAAMTEDPERRKALLTFVVVGGGPTGVEIAGALGEVKRYVISREYPTIDPSEIKVLLVEGTDRVLRTMSEKSSADALSALGQLMVDVELGKNMTSYSDGVVSFSDGSSVRTDTVIWTAGVTGVSFDIANAPSGFEIGPGRRFKVDEYNRIIGLEDVYAIGDIAINISDEYPRGCPQLAQVAIQQGTTLGHNLSHGRFDRPFRYRDKGSMATIGRNRAVVDLGKVHFRGLSAWLVWMAVHLMSLLGMRNKTVVFINWMWSYFTYSSGLRLLLRPSRYPLRHHWGEK